ncbi:reverse transcriptase family protein [Limnoglobus roseus]|uniref:RNA-directed DNA polymerase n=1 Tax=Limnoglobus roseus TaxID=2598579 RepID=A0A5C1ACM5_9BACT|nr:reverse transcriptase family protein [Limnoglobus roseus]QEL16375.1 RNA-directed DNA polymerase [Limnoglobus roseus]
MTDTPTWLLHALPANAVVDEKLNATLSALAAALADNRDKPLVTAGLLTEIQGHLAHAQPFAAYEAAVNGIAGQVWQLFEAVHQRQNRPAKLAFLNLVVRHLTPGALAQLCRRWAKDADPAIRRAVGRVIETGAIHEVALPATKDGAWSPAGWRKGTVEVDLSRHKVGTAVQEANSVPPLANLRQLRELLGIRSAKQLGYFLLASDKDDGPYTRFTVPKRGGGERVICAPKPQLKWVQRRIHERILSGVPLADAAHGFVPGRSIVSNAAAHVGAAVVVKFDLKDFFPTIHSYRMIGLFARMGYSVGTAKIATADESASVAPVLARLCSYTPDPRAWGKAHAPQGAPTSPAVSNLICRHLDARLGGLARKLGGVYTRYADDLTFSFAATGIDLGRFRWWVDQVCQQEGFVMNADKFRVIRRSQRQLVTGLVVNDGVRPTREQRRAFRAVLHNCRRNGVVTEARGDPRFSQYLRGFASYLHMVRSTEGADLVRQVAELLDPPGGGEDKP